MKVYKFMRKIILSIALMVFVLSSNAFGYDFHQRGLFVEKYKSDLNLYKPLKKILNIERKKDIDINEIFNSIELLSENKSSSSTEAMIGLLDFYFGEAPRLLLEKEIVGKVVIAIPFLKKKFFDKIIKNEWPNQKDEKAIIKIRNAELVDLLDHIYFKVPYAIDFDDLSPDELTRVKLFYIQKALRNYYSKKGSYPKELSDLTSEIFDVDILSFNDGWNHKYKYFGGIFHYFLQSNGADGIFGTKDDVGSPISPELYSFPKNQET